MNLKSQFLEIFPYIVDDEATHCALRILRFYVAHSTSSAGYKNDLSRRPVEERPISAPDSRTTYLKRDFCFSDFVVTALRNFKIRLL